MLNILPIILLLLSSCSSGSSSGSSSSSLRCPRQLTQSQNPSGMDTAGPAPACNSLSNEDKAAGPAPANSLSNEDKTAGPAPACNSLSSEEKTACRAPASGKILFFGNSITESWPKLSPEFFTSHGFIGKGISGQTTYQFLERFQRDAIDPAPDIIILNGATNDIAENTHPYSQAKTLENIRRMVEMAQGAGIEVVMTSTLPAAGFKWNRKIKDAPEKIKALNKELKKIAEEKGCRFVDYYPLMLAPDGRSMKPELTLDGVHPNAKGYHVMEKALKEKLKF